MFSLSRSTRVCCLLIILVPGQARFLDAQGVAVDDSAVFGMYRILETMYSGVTRDSASHLLDSILATPAFVTMFHHYNRSWRPNHLPPAVFKRMILSLKFPAEYSAGENQRADQMLPQWRRFYTHLAMYSANLRQLDEMNTKVMTEDAAGDARAWLPLGWSIPDYRLVMVPSGGSGGFTIDDAQGYGFFQLPRDSSGAIIWSELRSTIAHETHHLGVRTHARDATGNRKQG